MFITTDQEQKRLLTAWQLLGKEERRTVRLFAEFLSHQTDLNTTEKTTLTPQTPHPIPKPEKESAVLALKRLKKTYPMIEADLALLDDASRLLLKKIMGTTDAAVIIDLEELFAQRYREWKLNNTGQM